MTERPSELLVCAGVFHSKSEKGDRTYLEKSYTVA